MQPLHVLIPAAGAGTRMRSQQPKLLHRCAGIPIIEHVVRAAVALDSASVHVVVPPGADAIRQALAGYDLGYAVQSQPTGTADAVAAGLAALGDIDGRLLVVNGDCATVRASTLRLLAVEAGDCAGAVLAMGGDALDGNRGAAGDDRRGDALAPERQRPGADEAPLSGDLCCFDAAALRAALARLGDDNAAAERDLASVFALLADAPGGVVAIACDDDAVHGIDSRSGLARAEAVLRQRTAARLMDSGVTLRDAANTWLDVDVRIGADTVVHPGVIVEGASVIGSRCELRANVRITSSNLGNDVTVIDGTIVEASTVAAGAILGPYARLRPGCDIGRGAKVGNFVEVKATKLGAGSKASHLSYLGNAVIGDNVNVGAGTITCNYDGVEKHQTIIEDGAFIGSNTALVAPVWIGAGAYVGAGSTITGDVPAGALGVARGRQVNKRNWPGAKDRS